MGLFVVSHQTIFSALSFNNIFVAIIASTTAVKGCLQQAVYSWRKKDAETVNTQYA